MYQHCSRCCALVGIRVLQASHCPGGPTLPLSSWLQNPVPNAHTLAIAGRKPFIVVHTALLDLLTPAELQVSSLLPSAIVFHMSAPSAMRRPPPCHCPIQAVLAHELGHLKCEHGVWLTVAHVLAGGTLSVLPVMARAVEDNLLRWLRAAELTCDRAALLVAQDPRRAAVQCTHKRNLQLLQGRFAGRKGPQASCL